jgi:pre-mRNA-splicing factor ISY1
VSAVSGVEGQLAINVYSMVNQPYTAQEPIKKTRQDLYKNVDADYYGYRDEEDGSILEYEAEREKELVDQIKETTYQPDDVPDEMQVDGEDTRTQQTDANGAINDNLAKGAAVPTQQEIEQILVQRRRQQVSIKKFGATNKCGFFLLTAL